MSDTAHLRRSLVAAALVSTSVLSAVSVFLSPEFPSGFEDRLRAVADAGTAGTISAITFTLAQLPFIVVALGIGRLTRGHAPKLATVGAMLAVVGAFGHSVFGGVAMVQLSMADDLDNVAVHAALLEDVESSPAVAFMAAGLIGTVLGLLLLSIALWRAHIGPRWVPPVLWLFLVVEFVGAGLSDSASYVAAICYLLALCGLAVHVATTPAAVWAEAPSPDPLETRA